MHARQLVTLPNAITAVRLVAGPVCIWLLLQPGRTALFAALGMMIAAELSDLFDGMAARAWRQGSDFGKIFDPLADALYRECIFIGFAAAGWMPFWMLGIMIFRDIGVSYLREIAEGTGTTMGARASGKWKAVAQGVAQIGVVLLALFAPHGIGPNESLVLALLGVATAVTAWSLIDYTFDVMRRVRP